MEVAQNRWFIVEFGGIPIFGSLPSWKIDKNPPRMDGMNRLTRPTRDDLISARSTPLDSINKRLSLHLYMQSYTDITVI